MSNVVIVESPSKAKTINKYLGEDYKVLASYGHIRDLPSKNGSVDTDDNFNMIWEVDSKSQKQIKEITAAMKGADHLYLATDPDREGEAISWHVQEVLNEKKLLDGVDVKRVVFNEITKSAILDAFKEPRELDKELVDAYLARRALDYLVGFTLSPVLWRKLPGSRSAGRVQSVALRLITERETEIEAFDPIEYWSVKAEFAKSSGQKFTANLTHLNGERLDKLALKNEQDAQNAVAQIEAGNFSVSKIEKKQSRRNPPPPFTTSTLQQEAARKLHFSAKKTMMTAQRLYEGVTLNGETTGLITYMRTDGVTIAGEAISSIRDHVNSAYGSNYVPDSPRVYKTKAKNAQEAHEAIRPTDIRRLPKDLPMLDDDQRKLYQLIWNRTAASQMEQAVLDQVAADLRPQGSSEGDNDVTLRATGSVIAFDGFLRLYHEDKDENRDGTRDDTDDKERILPPLNEGEDLSRNNILPEQHFTQPPPRFSEASLVKKLEELGIGRPSTYASIISVLQDRNYVRVENRRFFSEDRGRLVTAFLSSFFSQYVEYSFTADLEEKLDKISDGQLEWKDVLQDFWTHFKTAVDGTADLRVREVLDNLNEILGPHFFHDNGDGNPRQCPSCADGELSLKLGRHGAFIGCSRYPECRHTRPLAADGNGSDITDSGPKELGKHPELGLDITLRRGPYGFYIQLGEGEGKKKPKRSSLTKAMDPAEVNLAMALKLLELPREVGIYPETGQMVTAGIGPFGPFIKLAGTYVSLKEDDVLTIGLNRACDLLANAPKKPEPREVGIHPRTKKPVMMRWGRWGPFVQHGKIKANMPKDMKKPKGEEDDQETPSLELALTWLAAKGDKTKAKKRAPAKKKAAKKKAAKKKAAAKEVAAETEASIIQPETSVPADSQIDPQENTEQ
ncbi:MAG: type I DNA topoisomerase [Rhodospirillaceae bacterium]|nr:type I DNA topoisomerase [Rhodospirillaceae bacterium]